jgi:pSer/pThr/pTyr-binding forkhead associated (FHA) protein
MVQFNILSGKKAGDQFVVRHFPFHVGRNAQNDLSLDDSGVWDQHLTIDFQKTDGINLVVSSNALASINNQPVQNQILHNADIISFGSVKLQFWLAVVRQRGMRIRENLVWALLLLVTGAQFGLLYWLIR